MTAGYLAALVERHLSPEPAVAPRARSAFEPGAADPFSAPLTAAPAAAEEWGMEEVDVAADPSRDGEAPRPRRARRLRA
ncbi:MAG: hypothetical protein KY467_17225, partial [Gemmatimonadetes bacterium]|nr:hypothetical protein [Gemmatimonadota bacterium]